MTVGTRLPAVALFFLSLLATVLVGGCGTAMGHPRALRLPIARPLQTDPALAGRDDLWSNSLVYDGLVQLDGSMNVVPDLAVALPTISDDGKLFSFTLRSDVHFADGRLLTPAAVQYSLARSISKLVGSAPAWHALHEISGAAAVRSGRLHRLAGITVARNVGEIRIRLAKRDPEFLYRLALPSASMVDPIQVRQGGKWWRRGAGTGPFTFEPGNERTLSINHHFYGGSLQVSKLILVHAGSRHRQLNLFRGGQLSVAAVPTGSFSRLSHSARFLATDTTTAYYLFFHHLSPAIRKAIDESLNRSLLGGDRSPINPASSLVPQLIANYPAIADPGSYQPRSAADELDHSKVSLSFTRVTPAKIRLWVTAQLKHVGTRVSTGTSRPSAKVLAVSAMEPSPQAWLRILISNPSVAGRHRVQALLQESKNVVESAQPQADWTYANQAESILWAHHSVLPLGILRRGYLISPRVQGLVPTLIGLRPSNEDWTSVAVT